MKCPYCNSNELKVIDKRDAADFDSTRRRRECLKCGKRFTTYERIENIEMSVIKKDGEKEPFNRQKLKEGILKACEKRPCKMEDIDTLVDDIETTLKKETETEISSSHIGELVRKGLKSLDPVAYLRYTSVYKDFSSVDSFKKEIDELKKDAPEKKVETRVSKVKKRDGKIADFDKDRVINAIFKAARSIGGKDKKMAAELANQVVETVNKRYDTKHIPNVEDIQDIVEKVLTENGHYQTVRSYILYRQQQARLRATEHMMLDVGKTVTDYLDKATWKIKENSNEQFSFSGLLLYTAGQVLSNYVLNNIYTPAIADAHRKGYVHVHDLSNGVIGYCAGWSLKNLLLMGFGGVPGKVDCKPAKHMGTVVHQMVNYIGCLQMEFAGAQAFSSVDTLLAPFVKADNMSFKEVKQSMQQLVFSLNIPSRWGSQYPFSNLTFDWTVPQDMKDEKAIVGGKRMEFRYSDCQKEMDIINKAFLEVMLEGDAYGRIFSFPIPTYNITKSFNWNSDNANLLFDVTAKYGTPYFQNYVGSNLDPSSIRAMCCRLNLNQNELMRRPGSMWAPGDSTGSIGVFTLNLNRMAYEAKDKQEFFDMIKRYMFLGKDSLEIKRTMINKNLKNGLMPYTKRYLGTFDNHFSTIGLCGMNEACLNLLGKDITSKEGKGLAIETLVYMRDICLEFQKETGNLFNLEATPAEGTSYRFARLDRKFHPDIITSGDKEPFLTNSTQLPVDYTDDPILAIEHQNDIQPLYTGGTIFHTFIGERMTNGESCKRLVRKIAHNTSLPYFSISPTFSICKTHGYLKGEQWECPECGEKTEVFSRIVGYYRPVQNWNKGKAEEFKHRVTFSEKKGKDNRFRNELALETEASAKATVKETTRQPITKAKGRA
ncbi:ribonucleoside triphosphate reductase [Candidatus Woesearchaeota archaeon]|nr:ribonucleoside triphosphate reductase [Candidatus Woesearchaeota archaeon]